MKTLIVSDIHLSHVFDEKKFLFLKKLFSSYDKVILNGDFWDGQTTTFDRFISSRWSELFPLLKRKEAIYLFGNHDLKRFSDKRTSLFSTSQKENHTLEFGSITYYVEHGHLIYPSVDIIFHLPRTFLKYFNIVFQHIECILVSLGSPHNILTKQFNKTIKKKLQKKQFPHWYLCGHTHFAEFDKDIKFANSGFIQYGKATYLIVDSSGLSLQTEWYK